MCARDEQWWRQDRHSQQIRWSVTCSTGANIIGRRAAYIFRWILMSFVRLRSCYRCWSGLLQNRLLSQSADEKCNERLTVRPFDHASRLLETVCIHFSLCLLFYRSFSGARRTRLRLDNGRPHWMPGSQVLEQHGSGWLVVGASLSTSPNAGVIRTTVGLRVVYGSKNFALLTSRSSFGIDVLMPAVSRVTYLKHRLTK